MAAARDWTFEAEDAAFAHRNRRGFIEHLRAHASGDSDLNAAEIIYGELVGNVIRHASGPIRIRLDWSGDYPVLRVRDFGAGFEHQFGLPTMLSESGRGLFIVRSLARKVEIECIPGGCEVRATLQVNPRNPR